MTDRHHETTEHPADMGVRGFGATIAESFEEAALAMFELAADTEGLGGSVSETVEVEGEHLRELLVEFLNALLLRADLAEAVFYDVEIGLVEESERGWRLHAAARGAPRGAAPERLRTEVKAATYCGARVEKLGDGWEARCIVDL